METLFSDRVIFGDRQQFYASVIPAIRIVSDHIEILTVGAICSVTEFKTCIAVIYNQLAVLHKNQ